jgi:hypothetical protein
LSALQPRWIRLPNIARPDTPSTDAPPAVVFGDLATSPLYTYGALFQSELGVQFIPTEASIRGGLSSLIWALIIVVIFKARVRRLLPRSRPAPAWMHATAPTVRNPPAPQYQVFVMSASYHHEGGMFALLNALKHEARPPRHLSVAAALAPRWSNERR